LITYLLYHRFLSLSRTFFIFFQTFFVVDLWSWLYSLPAFNPSASWRMSAPQIFLCAFIIAHFVLFVKGFFHFFEEILFYLHQVTRLREVVFFLPLTCIIILQNLPKVKNFFSFSIN